MILSATKDTELRMYLECSCSHPDHLVVISTDNADPRFKEVYISVAMKQELPWHKRIRAALRYLFNKKVCPYDGFTETVTTVHELQEIVRKIEHFHAPTSAGREHAA